MVSSRQVVDLIKNEIKKEADDQVISAYKQLINKIEVLEDIELTNMYKDYTDEENQREETKAKEARIQAEKLFNHAR